MESMPESSQPISPGPIAIRHAWWPLALVLLATCLAYLPAMRGGFIWDDDAHVTRPELRSLHGLARIWFDPERDAAVLPAAAQRLLARAQAVGRRGRSATTW